jgi:hypothetical protein
MLDDALVLDTWSAGAGAPSPVGPLLALARPELGARERGELAGDQANGAFVATLAALGEHTLDTLATCPGCGAPVEIAVPLDALPAAPPDGPAAPGAVTVGAATLSYRVPSVADLAAAHACPDADAAEALLVTRTLGPGVDPALLAGAAAAIDGRHPLLAPRVDVRCGACDAGFTAGLDLAEAAWAGLAAAAARLLDEVAYLARAYGWSEAEVLAVPPARRARYRQLVDDGIV